jgi:tetratricopeptide (TPR) repeat protein
VQPDPLTPLPELVKSGHFRSAAIKAAQLLTTPLTPESPSSGEDYARIFELVYTRLACLTLCNQTALAAQEVKALEDLNSSYYRDDDTGAHLVPWELRVLAVRLQGMGFNDARRGVMGYYDLAREARLTLTALKKQRKEDEELEDEAKLWENRLAELGIRVASALVEMEDLEGATRHLQTLKSLRGDLQMQKALLWLCLGDIDAARSCISADDENGKKVVQGLAHMADGDYSDAVKVFEDLVASGSGDGDIPMYKQNLGVCLLYNGKLDEVCRSLKSFMWKRKNNPNHSRGLFSPPSSTIHIPSTR